MHSYVFTIVLTTLLLASAAFSSPPDFDISVGKDGSCTHTTVQAAFNAVPSNSTKRTVIYIKNGTYKENLTLEAAKKNVTVIGQNRDSVKLTFDNFASKTNPSTGQTYGTSGSSSTYIRAAGFCAINLTFENSYGTGSQALAIYISGDKAVFYNCRFLGRQDTWYGDRCRQLIRKCYIEGTTDFLFGPSTTWFDSCTIYSYGGTAITAASTEQYVTYGYVFRHCTISGASGVATHLGRPWRPYAATSFIECSISSCIKGAGWDNWGDVANESTARYSEYNNTGSGAASTSRVKWARQLTSAQAAQFTLTNVLGTTYTNPPGKDDWNPLATLALYLDPATTTLQQPCSRQPAIPHITFNQNNIAISNTGTPTCAMYFQLLSIDGRLLASGTLDLRQKTTLPYNKLSGGIYHLKTVTNSGSFSQRIFIH